MAKNKIIEVQNIAISVTTNNGADFICLTDMANAKEGESRAADIIKNWLRNRYTLAFLGNWEQIYNTEFKVVEFDHFKMFKISFDNVFFKNEINRRHKTIGKTTDNITSGSLSAVFPESKCLD